MTLVLHFGPFPSSVPLNHANFPHRGGGGNHKGRASLLLILIYGCLPFYQPRIPPSKRILEILIDSLPLLFQHKII